MFPKSHNYHSIDCFVNACDEFSYPVVLTVYTASGTVTVEGIREDSIKHVDGTLTCEADDGSSKCPLYTFFRVIGYSSTFA